MKIAIKLILLFVSILSFGQNIDEEKLWITKGVYDSLGNFLERAKIQSFLYSSKSNQFYRLRTQDKINMETGETSVFIYQDTLNLKKLDNKRYRINDKEVITLHSNDSLTINYNGFILPYIKINLKRNKVKLKTLKTELINKVFIESVGNNEKYQLMYKDDDLVKIKPLDRDSEWESHYKIIDFNGYIIIQGIVSAPKLITESKKGIISFIEIDYRFNNKNGELRIKH